MGNKSIEMYRLLLVSAKKKSGEKCVSCIDGREHGKSAICQVCRFVRDELCREAFDFACIEFSSVGNVRWLMANIGEWDNFVEWHNGKCLCEGVSELLWAIMADHWEEFRREVPKILRYDNSTSKPIRIQQSSVVDFRMALEVSAEILTSNELLAQAVVAYLEENGTAE